MRTFLFVAIVPAACRDAAVAIAASRAGALGVLNLEYVHDAIAARQAVAQLMRHTDGECGIRFDSSSPELIHELLPDLPSRISTAILTSSDPTQWKESIAALHAHGLKAWPEVTSVSLAKAAHAHGADMLVARGHESGGWVGEDTTSILLQRLLGPQSRDRVPLPVLASGGIGLHTIAACYVAGASGAVLDSQLALARESHLPAPLRRLVSAMDGSETACLAGQAGPLYRACAPAASPAARALRETALAPGRHRTAARALAAAAAAAAAGSSEAGAAAAGASAVAEGDIWPLGQDAAFAAPLARRYRTVAGIIAAMSAALETHLQLAAGSGILSGASAAGAVEGAAAGAGFLGCRYPVVQGPMTRVSDTPAFALAVAEAGGLPFLALGLLSGPSARAMLAATQQLLAGRPWGAGILGFAPPDLRKEQLEAIRAHPAPYALVAGGRPDQVRELEQEGIRTWLHAPSPALLRQFLEAGVRRFVLEGRECGGHVGPRTSFVLWESAVDLLLNEVPAAQLRECEVLFAGGIHDALSAAMAATVAAPLAARGASVGVLMGTAYLFTDEAVSTGAILPRFRDVALQCEETVRLESGPGYETRCAPTPFVRAFEAEKRRLAREGKSAQETRQALEELNVGRLRVAAKGISRRPAAHSAGAQAADAQAAGGPQPSTLELQSSICNLQSSTGNLPPATPYTTLDDAAQYRDGIYMIGQAAALHHDTLTIAELHRDIAEGSSKLLTALAPPEIPSAPLAPSARPRPARVAIVGMSAILPKAGNLHAYWSNILNRVDAITGIPEERWDAGLYFDPDRTARDKIYSRWGGFVDPVPFDPLAFGIPPRSLGSVDPMHLLALLAAAAALEDAGYRDRPFPRERTSVILGASGGTGDLGASYLLRAGLPLLFGDRGFELAAGSTLPEWTEDSFAGLLLNVAAGRIANRFDLGGLNFVVDAACASSLAAVNLAVNELVGGSSDMVITGGVDTVQNPFGYLCFSKTQALSPSGKPRVFDADADGIVISEGVAMLVLKRLADAERDGDRIYAVIQGMGGSSDGRGLGLTAPRPEGQAASLERAYAAAGYDPTTVDLFEAHGTGTVVGDRTEAQSLARFLESHGGRPGRHAIGSVKSMIGHTKATAGAAGLVKIALSLYHKVLPPTLNVSRPNPNAHFGATPLYVNSEARPWLNGLADHPRRAGASAFGFGGTNFHATLEEYTRDYLRPVDQGVCADWPAELFLWSAPSRTQLADTLARLRGALDPPSQQESLPQQGSLPEQGTRLADLAHTLAQAAPGVPAGAGVPVGGQLRLAIVAGSLADLAAKLRSAEAALRSPEAPVRINNPQGVYLDERPLAEAGKVAFLFPGQGSQHPNMMRELAIHFREVRETFEQFDSLLAGRFPDGLSRFIFPAPAFTEQEEQEQLRELTRTDRAQPALGAAEAAAFQLLHALGVKPDMAAGHSYGEYVALYAAGVIDLASLARLSEARGRAIVEAARDDLGTMAATRASAAEIEPVIAPVADVWVANLNAATQTAISGTQAGIAEAIRRLEAAGIPVRPLPVACGFHSPLVAPAQARLAEVLAEQAFAAPAIPVFSNTTASAYPDRAEDIRGLLAEHLLRPVRFADEIEAMYEAGARIFVEVGPRNVLAGLTGLVLGGSPQEGSPEEGIRAEGPRPHLAVVTDLPKRAGLTTLLHALAQLFAAGVDLNPARLFEGRTSPTPDLPRLEEENRGAHTTAAHWFVDGSRAFQAGEQPDPRAPAAPQAPPLPLAAASRAAETPSTPRAPAIDQPQGAAGRAATLAPPATGQAPILPQQVLAGGGERESVMLQFEQLMSRFLETNRSVMMAYLQAAAVQGPSSLPAPAAQAASTPSAAVTSSTLPPTGPSGNGRDGGSPPLPPPAQAGSLVPQSTLSHRLLELVSERTGYPVEMLGLDVDLEATLGIDSIKRVEIFGALRKLYLPPDRQPSAEAIERLVATKTLSGVLEWFEHVTRRSDREQAGPDAAQDAPRHAEFPVPRENGGGDEHRDAAPSRSDAQADSGVTRLLIRPHPAPPLVGRPAPFPADRCIIITADGRGAAAALAAEIASRGGRAVTVNAAAVASPRDRAVTRGDGPGAEAETVDLGDRRAVADFVDRVRQQHGPVCGVIHLLPLQQQDSMEGMDLCGWRAEARRQVKSLFYLCQAAAGDLKAAGKAGAGWVVAASAMGGCYGLDPAEQAPLLPVQAGLTGFVKSLAQEWPGVRCKAIDFDPEQQPARCAGQVLGEMAAGDDTVEVGYRRDQRVTFAPVAAPVDQSAEPALRIDSGSVILLTGGARGITAEIACDLARRHRPTLLLVGASAPPAAHEDEATARLESPQEIKAALIARLRRAGQAPADGPSSDGLSLPAVEAEYRGLLKAREIRRNIAQMEQAGATVRYYQADVRNEQALRELISGIHEQYGRIDGVIHGAGIIEDKLIEEKTAESFDRVFDTKADSAFVLSQVLRPDALKFFVLFSSAAGAFGNRGQADYAAANEVINKTAILLDRSWPGRVVAINWGPWMKSGMVSAELQKQFASRGIHLIQPALGCETLEDELRFGRKQDAEVAIAGGLWGAAKEETVAPGTEAGPRVPAARLTEGPGPLLARASVATNSAGSFAATRLIDPKYDLYLADHLLDGKPVFPFAMAMELAAEVAQQGWPDLQVAALHGFQVLHGIVLGDGPHSVSVRATARPRDARNGRGVDVYVEILDPQQDFPQEGFPQEGFPLEGSRPYYRGTISLADRLPDPPARQPGPAALQPFSMSEAEAYKRWLFHGPRFQGISKIAGISPDAMAATCRTSSPRDFLVHEPAGARALAPGAAWLIDPLVFDSALQMIILWMRTYRDATPLPSRFESYRRFESRSPAGSSAPVQCFLRVPAGARDAATPETLSCVDIEFVGPDGALVGLLEGMECPSSAVLNRLAGQAAAERDNAEVEGDPR